MGSIAYLICLEDNHTEQQALLLAESIRQFGGRFSDAPIYSFSPRRGLDPNAATRGKIADLAIEHIDEVLNEKYHPWPQANKIYATAWAEENLSEDILIFTDSDSLFLSEPTELESLDSGIAACSAWVPGIASRGRDDPADLLWQTAAGICGTTLGQPEMVSSVTHERMRPYFNTGFIAASRAVGVFSIWRQCYDRLMQSTRVRSLLTYKGEKPSPYFRPEFFTEQLAFAIAVSQSQVDVDLLSCRYNCPFHYRSELSGMADADLSDLVHLHYLYYLNWPPFLESFDPPLDRSSRQYRFIQERTPLQPQQAVQWPPAFIDDFGAQMELWRATLNRESEG